MEGQVFIFAKTYIEGMFHLCDQICDKMSEKTDEGINSKFKDLLKVDLIQIVAYFTMADKIISGNDARCMSDLFDAPITPAKIKEIVLSVNLYSETFENTIPTSLKLFLDVDNMLYQANGTSDDDALWKKYMTTVLSCAYALEEANGRDYQQLPEDINEYFKAYCDKLIDYCNTHDEALYADIAVDFEKDMGSTSEKEDVVDDNPDAISDEEYVKLVEELGEIDARMEEICNDIERYKKMLKAAAEFMTEEEKCSITKKRVNKNKNLIQHLSKENEKRQIIVRRILDSGRECKRRNRMFYPVRALNENEIFEDSSIDELGLSIRTYNCLKKAGFNTVKELCVPKVCEYDWINKMGRNNFKILINTLDLYGFTFSGTEQDNLEDYILF